MLNALLLLSGVYTILDALAPRGVFAWQFSFAVYYAALCGLLCIAYSIQRFDLALSKINKFHYAYTIIFFLGFIGVLSQSPLSVRYVAGDAAVMSLPLLYAFAFTSERAEVSGKIWVVFVVLLGLAAITALISGALNIFPEYARAAGRFDAPHCILVASIAVWAARSGFRNPVAWSILVLLLALAALSGWRSYFVQALFVTALAYYILSSTRMKLALAAIGVVIVFTIAQQSGDRLIGIVESSRFSAVARLEIDDSTQGRINEVLDVARITREDASLPQIILGHGHGALFEPRITEAERNLAYDGLVHHIHFGPVMLFFRYGLLGLAVYLFLVVVLTRDFFTRRKTLALSPVFLVTFLGAAGTMSVSLFVNVFNEPLSMLALSIYVYMRQFSVPAEAKDDALANLSRKYQVRGSYA